MRSDYGLYSVAIVCFILAAVFAASLVPGYPFSETGGMAVTVVFLLIGIIAAVVGYSARPKAMMREAEPMPTPTPVVPIEETVRAAEKPTEPVFPPPPPAPVEEVQATAEPTPEPAEPSEPTVVTSEVEPVKTQPTGTPVEATTEKPKPTRRRRKKAAA
jgi:outer membrane biosynthesis protein TonB